MGLAAVAAATAVGAIGGGVIAAGGAKSAAKTAAAASDQASQVQKEIYGENKQLLSPYVAMGLPASAQINALLGLTPTQPAQSYGTPTYTQQPMNALGSYAPEAQTYYGFKPGGYPEDYSYLAPNAMGDMSSNGGGWGMAGTPFAAPQMQQAVPQGTVGTSLPSAQSAFDNYRNSTGYQFRVNEGMKAINSGFAGKGLLQSGSALKSLNNYGQGMASAEFGNYLNALGNQQQMGLSAAQATAGVGSGYANSLGSIAMANGANQANAALAGSAAIGGAVNSLGTGMAGILGQQNAMNSAALRVTTPVSGSALYQGGYSGLQPLSGGYGGF